MSWMKGDGYAAESPSEPSQAERGYISDQSQLLSKITEQ